MDLPLEFEFDRHKVPLSNGQKTFGKSLNGIQITMSGSFGVGTDGSTLTTSEQAMWGAFGEIGTHLATGGAEQFLEFFVYYDSASSTYRKLKRVRPVSFAASLGDDKNKLFGWTMVLFSEDPNIYVTAPGA